MSGPILGSNFHQYSNSNLEEEALKFLWHPISQYSMYSNLTSKNMVNFFLPGLKLSTHFITRYPLEFGNSITVYILRLAAAILNTHRK